MEIYEVYHYEQRGDLFTSYINSALKLKLDSSGFPKNVQSEEEKDAYIRKYFEVEGIQLDKDKIKKNPGLRTLSKLFLNCLWGFFAMQSLRRSHEFVRDRKRFYELLYDDRYLIHQEYFEEDSNLLQVIFSEKEEFHLGNDRTNVIVASFVTTYARLRLFDELDKLGERVLYFDTDSIFYIHKEDEYNPSLGDYLGQFTDELDPEDGNYIEEFVSTGPKSYAYRTDTGKQHCTIKGITFNTLASLILTFDQLKKIIDDQTKIEKVPQLVFVRKRFTNEVSTVIREKVFRFTYTKRIINSDFSTSPFGFKPTVS